MWYITYCHMVHNLSMREESDWMIRFPQSISESHSSSAHSSALTTWNGWQKMLPTWSDEEQSEYFRSPQFESEYSKEVVQRAYENIGYSVDPFEGISKLQYLDRALWRGLKRPYWRRETSCVSAISSLSSVAGWTSCPTCWCIGTRRWYSRWQVRLRLLTGCLLLGLSIRASTSPPAEEQHTRDRGAQQVQCWHLLRRRWRDLVRATLTARPSDFDHCSNI